MPLLQERVIAAFFLSLFLVFYGGKAMKIYVKESKSLSIQTVSLMFYDSVTIVPLLSLDDVLYSDLIIVSQSDVDVYKRQLQYCRDGCGEIRCTQGT